MNGQNQSSVHGRIGPLPTDDNTFQFEPGQRLQHGLTVMEVVRVIQTQCVLRNLSTHEEKFVDLETLYDEYANRRLIPLSSTEVLTNEANLLPYECSEFEVLSDMSAAC